LPYDLDVLEPINHQLEIDGFFWDRDSHGLFDFESRTLKQASLTVVGCSQLAREKTLLKSVMPSLEPPSDYQMLISVIYKQGMYWIYHNRSLFKPGKFEKDNAYNHTDQAWLIVRYQN
jgi:hypothetical protein